jgi:dihydrofolate synthase/folylpolyglutamate synthase
MAVITNIGIDHVAWLGDNIEDIGAEKAGILRDGITLIYGATEMPNSVQQLIDTHNASCYQAGKDFSYRVLDAAVHADSWQYSNAAVTLQLPRPALSLINTANALSAVLASPLTVEIAAIEQALQTVKLAGRFDYRQVLSRHWLFDVAHNEQGVAFLLAQLLPLWQQHIESQADKLSVTPPAMVKMLFSMLEDKDIDMVVQHLIQSNLPITDWYIAEIDHPRAASIEQLQTVLSNYVNSANLHVFADLQQAASAVIEESRTEDLIVVCGSFHTIGETLATLDAKSAKL